MSLVVGLVLLASPLGAPVFLILMVSFPFLGAWGAVQAEGGGVRAMHGVVTLYSVLCGKGFSACMGRLLWMLAHTSRFVHNHWARQQNMNQGSADTCRAHSDLWHVRSTSAHCSKQHARCLHLTACSWWGM